MMINPTIAFLTSAFMGCVVLMMGFLILRESDQSFSEAFRECLFWGTGLFIAVSVQILAITTL